MNSHLLLPLILMSAACSVPLMGSPKSSSHSHSWLVGGWVPKGEDCESDAGVRYDPDGKWIAYEQAGTWLLEKLTLATTTTQRWESGGVDQQKLGVPEQHTTQIEAVSSNIYRVRFSGKVVEMRRCSQ
jgi:hypothetical protein